MRRHDDGGACSGWVATCGPDGGLLLERVRPIGVPSPVDAESTLERHADAFTAIASDMGAVLDRCAISVNVKERRDYSCTLHDPSGRLVVNAPHLPVHLGSMGVCVRRVAAALTCGPGDVVLTNHPAFGGSHLPDLTVITPVHDDHGTLLGWTASRAHHAELGGSRPGSMPPGATTLLEEGVVLPPMKIIEAGRSCFDALERRLTAPPWPTRALEDNLADVQAAVAANHRGATALRAVAAMTGASVVIDSMNQLQDRAAALARQLVQGMPDGRFDAIEHMDDGSVLAVGIDVHGDRMRVDFTGTAAVHPGNLNATDAIVRSVVLYVLRLLVSRRVPLNEGLLAPVELVLPECMLSPRWASEASACPAVVGGNVETSQRLVDLLLKRARPFSRRPGHDEQHVVRHRRFRILRNARWWSWCNGGSRWCFGGALPHEQHANHRPGALRASVSGAIASVRSADRKRRRRGAGPAGTGSSGSSSSCSPCPCRC